MIGKTLAQYEILEAIGAGGMGEVWRARDKTPDRDVALERRSTPVSTRTH